MGVQLLSVSSVCTCHLEYNSLSIRLFITGVSRTQHLTLLQLVILIFTLVSVLISALISLCCSAAGCTDFPAFIGVDICTIFYAPSSQHVPATKGERETETAGCIMIFLSHLVGACITYIWVCLSLRGPLLPSPSGREITTRSLWNTNMFG